MLRTSRRGAFTLVEMLVVIGIIMLVATLALPSIISARRSSQVAVGAAQMKSLNDMLMNRAMERKGRMLSIERNTQQTDAMSGVQFTYANWTRFYGEGFMAYWLSFLEKTDPGGGLRHEMGVSPADGEIVGLKANCPPGGDFLMPASFYYSAAMFNSWSEYDFTATSNPCCPSPYGPMYRGDCCDPLKNCEPVACGVGSAQMEQITFPDSKVVLFERADFMKPSRSQSLGNGKTKDRPLPPAWNNPRSKPHTAMADGSVATANMTILTLAAADSIKNDADLAMVPVDLFAAPDRLHSVGHDGNAVIDLTGETDDLYPYFFAGTRYGVRGRDLNNEARK